MAYNIKKFLVRCPNHLLALISIILTLLSIELFFPIASNCWQWTFKKFISSNDKFYIYAVGGSTMEGFPFPGGINPATINKEIFNGKINGKDIEVITIARAAEDIHNQYIRLQKNLLKQSHKNAVILLYTGINEFAAHPVRDTDIFPKWAFLRKSVLLRYSFDFVKTTKIPFFENSENDYILYLRKSSILKYEYFLNQMALLAKKHDIPLIISTLTCNTAGFNPLPLYKQNEYIKNNLSDNLQKLKDTFPHNKQQSLQLLDEITISFEKFDRNKQIFKHNFIENKLYEIYLEGLLKEKQGYFRKAINLYNKILLETKTNKTNKQEDYDHINTAAYFRIGKSREKQKQFKKAQEAYTKALPYFYPSIKPPIIFNKLIKETAKKHNLLLTDSESLIISHAKNNLPDYDMFFDAHHPNYKSAILISYGFAEKIKNLTGEPLANLNISEEALKETFNLNEIDTLLPAIRSINWILITINIINEENINAVRSYLEELRNTLTLASV